LGGDAEWDRVIQRTSHQLLYFVGSGTRRPDAPELLDSAAMMQLVTTLRSSASVIIVDTPPLAAGVDALELATALGQLVLVLRLGTTDFELAQAKLKVLERLPVRLLGTVLNDARENEGYEKYYYHLEGYELGDEGRPNRTLINSPR
jgi:Mrp family chromosome partitioning ATPase